MEEHVWTSYYEERIRLSGDEEMILAHCHLGLVVGASDTEALCFFHVPKTSLDHTGPG